MAKESLEEALLKQIKASNHKMVDYILKLGADVNKVKIGGKSLLIWAIEVGDPQIIEKLEQEGAKKERLSSKQRDDLGCELFHKISNDASIDEIEALILNGAKIEYIDIKDEGKNCLMLAAEKGRKDVVEKMLPYVKDIDDWDMEGRTAVTYACCEGHWDVIELLVKNGVDVNIVDESGKAAINHLQDKEMVRKMIELGAEVDSIDALGNTLLIDTIKSKDLEFAKYLIEKGVDIKVCNHSGYSAMSVAIMEKMNDFALELIEQNVGLETPIASCDRTPLHIATEFNNIEFVEMLLDKGVDINAKDSNGDNALMYAIRGNRMDIANLLIERGININERNKNNEDALQLELRKDGSATFVKTLLDRGCWHDDINYLKEAVMHSDGLTLGVMLDLEKYKGKEWAQEGLGYCADCTVREGVIEELVKRGADINYVNENGENILVSILKDYHAAAIGNFDEIMKCGIDVNFRDSEGNTALHYAAKECHKWSLKKLVESGVNIDVQNNKGQTPLMLSMTGRDYVLVFDLLEYGADINIKDNDGKKAIHYAQARGEHMVSMFVHRVNKTTDVRAAKKVDKVKNKFLSLFGSRGEK